MGAEQQVRQRPGPSSEDRAAQARAYLDLWERQLVHAAVRSRLGPAVAAGRKAPAPDRPSRA
ncbi:MAG: hypothetical protein QM699_00725 [Amaricoccus sp.]|uniref:hypothetical protein n=1 Tax=Amaricoccus sp. TaxID=1872485 RepID=UPI0039E528C5